MNITLVHYWAFRNHFYHHITIYSLSPMPFGMLLYTQTEYKMAPNTILAPIGLLKAFTFFIEEHCEGETPVVYTGLVYILDIIKSIWKLIWNPLMVGM